MVSGSRKHGHEVHYDTGNVGASPVPLYEFRVDQGDSNAQYFPFVCVCVCCSGTCLCTTFRPGGLSVQERVSNPLELELWSCEVSCRCWNSNLGPWEEEQVLLTTEPPL